MIVRFSWRTLFLAALCLVPTGCEPLRSWLRHDDDSDKAAHAMGNPTEDDLKSRKVIGGDASDADTSSFFKSDRRSGAWSSEAREIESHLGAK
jgi:hypothetical protein